MSRIKVVHLITTLDTGGAERTLHRLMGGIDHSAFDNVVVSLTSEGLIGPMIRQLGVPVRTLNMRRGVPSARASFALAALLKNERPAILQTWLYHADLLGTLVSRIRPVRRLIWNIRCSEMDMSQYSILSRAIRPALAFISRIPDAVVVNSEAGRTAHQRYGYSPRRWELIPNGVDAAVFSRDEAGGKLLRLELGIESNHLVIGTLGRFDPMKDYRTFFAAVAPVVAKHPAVRIVMAGRGMEPNNPDLMHMISSAGLASAVTLLGERLDVARVLSAFDVYCLSSMAESFPNAVAEAMACEVPVVATDAGDTAWITGMRAVPPANVGLLSEALNEAVQTPVEERRRWGAQLRDRIRREFDLSTMIGKYESLYRELGS